MTEHRKKVGALTMLMGVFVFISGVMLVIDYLTEGDRWEVALKGPVWMVLGFVLVFIGREFANE